MAQTTVYKPSTISKKGGIAFLVDESGSQNPPVVTLKDGRKITAKFYNQNEGRKQFLFPKELANEKDFTISYDGQTTTIGSGSTSYEGSDFSSLQPRAKGSLGSGGGSANYSPNQVGQYGFAPADLTDQFPDTQFANYKPIKAADYKYTDPFKFAQKYGDLNRQQTVKNYNQSKQMGLDAVQTELQGLMGYAPAAAALQQGLVSADNQFNQQQRTQQVDTALPGVRGQLEDQSARATSFANGRVPDAIQDRALELGIRSGAADRASAGGFGVNSSASSKASDLMSAEKRIQLSQYGDQLLSGNINQKAGLFLAPTEYANAGSQIKVNPNVDAATRASQFNTELNNNTIISPTNALNSTIQQRQFATNLNQQTNQFNASNQLNTSQFNATSANNMNLQKFGYQVGLAGANAGAAQTNLNTGIEIQQQQKAQDAANSAKKDTQNANTIGSIATGVVGIGNAIINALGGKSTTSGSTTNNNIETSFNGIDDSLNSGNAALNNPSSSFNSTPNFDIDTGYQNSTDIPYQGLGDTSSFANPVALAAKTGLAQSDATKLLNFSREANIPLSKVKALPATSRALVQRSSAVLQASGISNVPQPGHIQAGFDTQGKPVYVDKALATSNSIAVGANTVHTAKSMIAPFNVFKGDDLANFNKISDIASNPGFIKGLDAIHMNGSASDFVNTLNQALKTINGTAKKLPAKVPVNTTPFAPSSNGMVRQPLIASNENQDALAKGLAAIAKGKAPNKLPAKVGGKLPFSTTSVRGL